MSSSDPTTTASANAPRNRWRKLLLWSAVLGLLGSVLLLAWLPQVVRALAPPIAGRFGYQLSIERIERLDLTGLELRGFVLRDSTGSSPLELLQADTLRLDFDRRLLSGQLEGIQLLRSTGLRVRIQPDAGESKPVVDSDSTSFTWPAGMPQIDVQDSLVTIADADGEDLDIAVHELQLDGAGQLRLRTTVEDRQVSATGLWQAGVLRDLNVTVDGLTLLEHTKLDLVQVANGHLALDAQLQIGSDSQTIAVELQGSQLSWQANLQGLDLAQLEERLPMPLGVRLAGHVTLDTEGALDLAQPLQGAATATLDIRALQVDGLPVQSLQADLQLRDAQLHIVRLECVQSDANRAHIEQALLPLDDLTLDNWLPRARAHIALELTDVPGLLAHMQQDTPESLGAVTHRLALQCVLGDSRLTLVECGLQSAAGNVELTSASVDLTRPGQLQVEARGNADLHDLQAIGNLLGRTDWAGALEGELGLLGEWPKVRASLDLSGTDLTIEGLPLGRLALEMNSSAIGHELDLTHLSIESPQGSLLAQLQLEYSDKFAVQVSRLELQRGGYGLALQEPLQLELQRDAGRIPPLVLDGTSGHLELQGEWDASGFDMRLACARLEPAGIAEPGAEPLFALGPVQVDLRAISQDGKLTFSSKGHAKDVTPVAFPEPLDLEWDFDYVAERLRVRVLDISGREGLRITASGELPLDFTEGLVLPRGDLSFELDANVPLAVIQNEGQGVLSARGNLSGSWTTLAGELHLDGSDLRLDPDVYPTDLASTELHGSLHLKDGLELRDVSIQLGDWIQTRLNGTLTTSTDATRWLDNPTEVLEQSEVQGDLQLAKLDITNLRPMLVALSPSATPLMEGELTSEVRFAGPLLSPRWDGTMSVRDARLRPGGGLPPVEALNMDLVLDDRKVQFKSVRGTLGAAPFTLTGDLDFSGAAALLDLQLVGKDLLLLRDEKARVRADTELTVRGPLAQLVVAGEVRLTTGYYAPDVRFLNLRQGPTRSGAQGFQLFAFRDAPLRDMSFDVKLGANRPFQVRNSILKGAMRPDLHLGGTGLVPLLTGTVYLEPTRLSLPAAQLTLSSGTVRFLKDNPFVPELDIIGETRMLGYDIRADITGPYDEPELLLTSTPPLNQEDLFLLVLTGRLPEDPDRNDALSTANTVAVYLARDTLARWFEDDGPLDEDTILERLEFIVGQDVSKNGIETFDVGYRLTRRAGKPRDKKDARHVYLATQRDKYEDYNFGLRLVFRFKR